MKSEQDIKDMAMEHGLNAEETCNICGEVLLWEHKANSFAKGYNQAQKDMIEQIEKLKIQNEILKGGMNSILRKSLIEGMTIQEVAVLATRESLERYIVETQTEARQALRDVEGIDIN